MIVDRSSHLNLQLPLKREEFAVSWTFTSKVRQRMAAGFIPETFEDCWFILMEENWLYFHRAHTGTCIFGLKVVITTEETKVSQGWVNRGTAYISESIDKDIQTVRILISQYFQTASFELSAFNMRYLAPSPLPLSDWFIRHSLVRGTTH